MVQIVCVCVCVCVPAPLSSFMISTCKESQRGFHLAHIRSMSEEEEGAHRESRRTRCRSRSFPHTSQARRSGRSAVNTQHSGLTPSVGKCIGKSKSRPGVLKPLMSATICFAKSVTIQKLEDIVYVQASFHSPPCLQHHRVQPATNDKSAEPKSKSSD